MNDNGERKIPPGTISVLGLGVARTNARGVATFNPTIPRYACSLDRIIIAGADTQLDEAAELTGLVLGDRVVLRRPWPLAYQTPAGIKAWAFGPPAPWEVFALELPGMLPALFSVRVSAAGVLLTGACKVTIL